MTSAPTASTAVMCAKRASDSNVAATGAKKRLPSVVARLYARSAAKMSTCSSISEFG